MQNEAISSSTSMMSSGCEPLGGEILDLGEISESSATLSSEGTAATTSSRVVSCKPSSVLLQETIEKLFENLTDINIENLITFWLTLSTPDCDAALTVGSSSSSSAGSFAGSSSVSSGPGQSRGESILYLNESTANYLLEYLNEYAFMTVKLWHLAFRMLTQLLNTAEKQAIARAFTLNEAMYKLIYKFLSTNEELVGDECCQSLIEFLRRFGECIAGSDSERVFKMKLFHILCSSIESNGCVNRSQGPIDAQVTFIELLIGIKHNFFSNKIVTKDNIIIFML